MAAARRHLGAWLLWWVALFWFWMLLVGEWNTQELVAAAVTATIVATTAEFVRTTLDVRFRVPLRLVPSLVTALAMVFADFAIVMAVLVRSVVARRPARGRFVVRDFDAGGDDPRSFGRRAWTILVAGYSPNAYVVDIDSDNGEVLLHDLVPFRKSEEPA